MIVLGAICPYHGAKTIPVLAKVFFVNKGYGVCIRWLTWMVHLRQESFDGLPCGKMQQSLSFCAEGERIDASKGRGEIKYQRKTMIGGCFRGGARRDELTF